MPFPSSNLKGKIKLFTLLLGIGFFALLLIFLTLKYLQNDFLQASNQPINASDSTPTLFQVENNENPKTLTRRLKEAGFIENDLYFWWYLRSNNLIPKIQAGTHYLAKSYNYEKIASELSKARPKEISITIPEGFTIEQIDARLAEKKLTNAGAFITAAENFDISDYSFLQNSKNNLEGYLFPDTYQVFADNFQSPALLVKMLNNFQRKIEILDSTALKKKNFADIVIIASIVEKETNAKDNRAIVAGILWKRIELGMSLGADAATRYGIKKPSGDLTEEDLKSDSPYNTRKFRSLPPGPICNPGLDSLEAAIKPEKSDYLYYLHDSNGDIHYAKTNDEHNVNKEKYL